MEINVCKSHAASSMELSVALLELADELRPDCEHDDCLLLDGLLRECAGRIRHTARTFLAELEMEEAAALGAEPTNWRIVGS